MSEPGRDAGAGGPPVLLRTTVQPEWLDYNGHMNVAYYVLAFDKATDILFDRLEIGGAYRERTGCTVYALEAHVVWKSELKLGEAFRIEARIVDADEKRFHLLHHMWRERDGALAAYHELLFLHVDQNAGPRSAPFPEEARARIEAMRRAHSAHPPHPDHVGRRIALRRS